MIETVTLQTVDGVVIIGSFAESIHRRGILLLHMMPATRESWDPLLPLCEAAQMDALAIDLRGHGESTDQLGTRIHYQTFTPEDHQRSRFDVDRGIQFLQEQNIPLEHIAIVGASIGANLAIDALSRYQKMRMVVALSPGLDYRGVLTMPAIEQLQPHQSVLLVASQEDEYAYESCKKMCAARSEQIQCMQVSNAGHGTDMMNAEKGLDKKIIEWIDAL